MTTLNLTNPNPGDTIDAAPYGTNYNAIEAVLNGGLDDGNVANAAAIAVSKLAVGSAGQFLRTVSGVPTWQSVFIVSSKAADETRTSTTTLSNDADLALALSVATYQLFGCLFVSGSQSGDITVKLNYGGTVTSGLWSLQGPGTGETSGAGTAVTVRIDSSDFTGSLDRGCLDTAAPYTAMPITGLIVAGTASTLNLQWAQRVSNGTATRIRANSFFIAQRVS